MANNKYTWWGKRTKIEKVLLVLIVFSAFAIMYLASNLMLKFPSNENLQQDVCMTENCIRSAASILNNMDKTVNPCDDFYKFACGNFVKNTIIPDDKTQVSSFSDISDKITLQLMKIFEEPIHHDDLNSLRLLKSIYKSCMNTTKIEVESVPFIKKTFKDLGGWPVLETNYWSEKLFDWKTLLYRLKRMGWRRNFFFSMYVGSDMKNNSRKILTISQPCMPYERMKKGLNDTTVMAGYNYLVNLAVLFGADKIHALAEMKEVIEFEITLAKSIIPWEQRKNYTKNYNVMTVRALQRNYASLPWLQLINNYLSPVDMFTSDDIVNVQVPEFLEKLEDLLLKTNKRVLANYMFSRIVRDSVTYLSEGFRNKEVEYYKVVYGKNQETPRWKQCVFEAARLHIATSSVFIGHLFDRQIRRKVSELVTDIKNSFLDTLKKVGWMDRKTKNQAIIKTEKMGSFIAYPEEILDYDQVEKYYEGLEISPDEYFLKVTFNLSTFSHMKHVETLRERVIKPDWRDLSYIFYVNAYYNQVENAIELPAAILQGGFFDPDRPQYLNYGSIGEIIGHEITHGFDDVGRQYDKDGNVVDWWEEETNRTFTRKSQCLVDQYGNYTVPEIDMNLNGVKTLGENIADNGGIKIAYKGYLKWMERNEPELALPGLPYTPRQLFWIAVANNWCIAYKKESLKQQVISGQHSPNQFRVLGPFSNSDNFGKDFNCPLGSPMNPKYKCRVW